MNNSKIESSCFKGGYFIYQNENHQNDYITKDELKITLKNVHSIKKSIISLLRNAKTNIKLCSFVLSDPEIYSELNSILNERKIAVFILTQLDQSRMSTSFLVDEENSENFSQNHIDYISKLYANGAHIRAAKFAHAKFIIVDNKEALLMSANITPPSLNENPESGVIIEQRESIDSLVKLFDIIFQYGTEYTRFKVASKDKQFVVSRDSTLKPEWLKKLPDSNIKFTWGESEQSLYYELINLINNGNANGRVLVSTYSVVGLEKIPDFIDAIKGYIQRGGKVVLFCRGMNYRSDHLKNCTLLKELGVEIYGDLFNHSKGLINDESGFIFTANIDGNHGLINGFEVGCILEKKQKDSLEEFIEWQIENAPFKFQMNPNKDDFFNTYTFYANCKGINPLELPKSIVFIVSNPKLEIELQNYPIYVLLDNSKTVRNINVGNSFYSVKMDDNQIEIVGKINRVYNMETYLLQTNDITINVKNKIVQ